VTLLFFVGEAGGRGRIGRKKQQHRLQQQERAHSKHPKNRAPATGGDQRRYQGEPQSDSHLIPIHPGGLNAILLAQGKPAPRIGIAQRPNAPLGDAQHQARRIELIHAVRHRAPDGRQRPTAHAEHGCAARSQPIHNESPSQQPNPVAEKKHRRNQPDPRGLACQRHVREESPVGHDHRDVRLFELVDDDQQEERRRDKEPPRRGPLRGCFQVYEFPSDGHRAIFSESGEITTGTRLYLGWRPVFH